MQFILLPQLNVLLILHNVFVNCLNIQHDGLLESFCTRLDIKSSTFLDQGTMRGKVYSVSGDVQLVYSLTLTFITWQLYLVFKKVVL